MTFAASASPTRCEPGSRSRLLPDKATISTPFFRCCVDASAFSDSFVDRRVAVLCGVAIYNLLSFSVPPWCFCQLIFYMSRQTSQLSSKTNMNQRALHRAFMTICVFCLTKGCLSFASSHLGFSQRSSILD